LFKKVEKTARFTERVAEFDIQFCRALHKRSAEHPRDESGKFPTLYVLTAQNARIGQRSVVFVGASIAKSVKINAELAFFRKLARDLFKLVSTRVFYMRSNILAIN
jgi:hypothetical protein